ncbi:hypothetical protein [Komagataeibacter xylinus]|nr:hypothetical protein [Komagataeibacter xylinus]
MARKPLTLRGWATPLTMGSFFLMAGTGSLMFFWFGSGLLAVVHRWCSWIFLVAAGGHIAANVRPFKNHLKSGIGAASAATFLLFFGLSMWSWGLVTKPGLMKPVIATLADAPLDSLAALKREPPDTLVAILRQRGLARQRRSRCAISRCGMGSILKRSWE